MNLISGTDRRPSVPSYVYPLWALVAVFFAAAVYRSRQVGIWFRDPHGHFFFDRMLISLCLLAIFALADALIRAARSRRGWRELTVELRHRWTGQRLLLTVTGLAAYHLIYLTYHNLKSWDVFLAPRDAMMLRADRWLFFGHTPATLLHELLGTGVANAVLVGVYQSFSAIIDFAVVAYLAFAPRSRDAYVALAALAWIWILGIVTYYAIPTLGPFWIDPAAFAHLPHSAVTASQANLLDQRAFLLAHPSAPTAFAQVSAFASLHVGVSTTALLLLRYFGFRRLFRTGCALEVAVMVATIYLGWHFVLDDIAGLAIAFLAVRLGRKTIYLTGGEPEPGQRAWNLTG